MKLIPLSNGGHTVVDDDVFDNLSKVVWHKTRKGYAYNLRVFGMMHRVILPPTEGMQVDHINGDKLDNRRENLRLCTTRQNCWNQGPRKNNTSGYKGVRKSNSKWQVSLHGEIVGRFDCPKQAYKAYCEAVIAKCGEFTPAFILNDYATLFWNGAE